MKSKHIKCITPNCNNLINRSSRGRTPLYCKECGECRKGYKSSLKHPNWGLCDLKKLINTKRHI